MRIGLALILLTSCIGQGTPRDSQAVEPVAFCAVNRGVNGALCYRSMAGCNEWRDDLVRGGQGFAPCAPHRGVLQCFDDTGVIHCFGDELTCIDQHDEALRLGRHPTPCRREPRFPSFDVHCAPDDRCSSSRELCETREGVAPGDCKPDSAFCTDGTDGVTALCSRSSRECEESRQRWRAQGHAMGECRLHRRLVAEERHR